MFSVLKNRSYFRLFSAQVIALVGTGLLTVALALLAYDLAGDRAGAVLGTVFAIKMIAYVGLAPLADAIAGRWPRKVLLIGADVTRGAVALLLPFITEIWQVYALIFVLQAASAAFTPAFQATIPDILTDERDYTNALSLSRLAYDLENLLSPALAGFLLTLISYHWLFGGTVAGFFGSAFLVWMAAVPPRKAERTVRPFVERMTRGVRIYLAKPRLRGLLALNLTAASAGAFVLVNTVVIVRGQYGAGGTSVAAALAAFGAGSMLSAIVLPRLLETLADRIVMVRSGFALALLTLGHAVYLMGNGWPAWAGFVAIWGLSGVFYSAILTPSGRLLRISAHPEDRPSVFAAQFTLSHTCWLVTYPLAGWAGTEFGLAAAMLILGLLALAGFAAALMVWPAEDPLVLDHEHSDLPSDHPHLRKHPGHGRRHRHAFVIDDEHRAWPTHG
ncbi:MFS transporter [Hoeflea sp.]|uniref:MFS transporter n=1 Tax=Hoeflea sp. TaxID=1940281 RepID=UPI003B52BC6A